MKNSGLGWTWQKGVSVFFSGLNVLVLFLVVLFFGCFGGFKGQVRWPEGPTHLALTLPYFCFFLCYLFVSLVGGFKGQVRWPEGPPHLALSPRFWCCCYLLCLEKKGCFPLKKRAFLLIFQCLPLFLPSLSHFPFSLSLSQSLSISLFIAMFLLYSFLFSLFFLPYV